MRRAARGLLVACVLTTALGLPGCAKRVVPPVPQGEDYLFAAPAPGEVSADEAAALRAAWSEVLAGDTASAERRYEKLLKRRPGLVAARTGLAFARLRAGRLEEASASFDAVLTDRPDDLPALVGAASAAVRRGDADAALGFYRRAQAAAPDDALVRKRLAALRLQVTERHLGLAQAAVERGDAETAVREYAAALEAAPEVAGVRLTLADLLASRGDVPGALALLEADPSGDRQVALRRAGLLMEQQEFARAAEVYRGLMARDPADEAARAGEKMARESLELLSMPEEYRRIREAPRVTRADLAALVAVHVGALRRAGPGRAPRGGGPRRVLGARVRRAGPRPRHHGAPTRTTRSSPAPSCAGWTWHGRRRARSTGWATPGAPLPPRPTCPAPTSTTRRSSACSRRAS